MYVVGLGTKSEHLFVRKDAKLAIAHAKETKERLLQLHVTQLCAAAIAEIFGET